MLDFYFIPDDQPNTASSAILQYTGGIEEEEFEVAQKAGVLEDNADYYGKLCWSNEQVTIKAALLANCPVRASLSLNSILNRAVAAGVGLRAFGD